MPKLLHLSLVVVEVTLNCHRACNLLLTSIHPLAKASKQDQSERDAESIVTASGATTANVEDARSCRSGVSSIGVVDGIVIGVQEDADAGEEREDASQSGHGGSLEESKAVAERIEDHSKPVHLEASLLKMYLEVQ